MVRLPIQQCLLIISKKKQKKTKTKSEKKYKNQWHLALLTVFGVEVDVHHFYDLAFQMQISGGKQCCGMFRALVLD